MLCKVYFLMMLYQYLVTGVHDSFWTQASDFDHMNKILREKCVELYKGPILENLSSFRSYIYTLYPFFSSLFEGFVLSQPVHGPIVQVV